jgi:hypothetical protein
MCKAGIRFDSAGPIWLLRPRRAERCYGESGELGISTVELARRLQQAQATASQSVERGGEIVAEEQFLMGCRLRMTKQCALIPIDGL